MRLESALIDGTFPDGLPAQAQADGVGSCYPMQQAGEAPASRRSKHQVPVVGQQAVRDKRDRVAAKTLSQNGEKLAIIARLGKERGSACAAIDDVIVVAER
jgi:hypothetical protein